MEKKLSATLAEIIAQFEEQGPVRVMFQDEARFGRISDTRRCWCPKPERPMVKAMVTQEYTYAYAAVSPLDGQLDSLILPHVNGECMQLFLDEVAARYPRERIVMVLDGAGWHKSHAIQLPSNLRLLSLPAYSPELNPVEILWGEVREKYFHNRLFNSMDALEDQLELALSMLEKDQPRVHSITGWAWIINSLSIAN
jgi:putative transposase